MFAQQKVADKEATSFPPLKMYSIKPITTSLSEFEPPQNAILTWTLVLKTNLNQKTDLKHQNRIGAKAYSKSTCLQTGWWTFYNLTSCLSTFQIKRKMSKTVTQLLKIAHAHSRTLNLFKHLSLSWNDSEIKHKLIYEQWAPPRKWWLKSWLKLKKTNSYLPKLSTP